MIMSSDNPSGAVNQQERPSSAEWLDVSSKAKALQASSSTELHWQLTSIQAVNLESSETIRKAPSLKQRDEDMAHAS
jgi:hypothetical protein